MIGEAAFPFFARRRRSAPATTPRNLNQPDRAKRPRFWHRRAPTTFHKCLAVHMYFAAPQRARQP